MSAAASFRSTLLRPGRQLMDRLSLSGKFSIVACLMGAPVLVLAALFLTGMHADLETARSEHAGGKMFVPAVTLLDALQDHAVASGRLLTGETLAADAVKSSMEAGRKALSELQAFDRAHGADFGTGKAVAALQDAVERVWSADAPKDPMANLAAHDAAILATQQAIARIYEGSGIILDPEAGPYYLGNATADASVEMLLGIGRIRVLGMKAIAATHPSLEQRAGLGAAGERVRFNRDRFIHEIEASGILDSAGAGPLKKVIDEMNDGVERLLTSLNKQVISATDIDIDPEFFDHKGTHALNVAQTAEAAALAAFNERIEARVAAYERSITLTAMALALAIALVAYCFQAFRMGVLSSVRSIAAGAQQLTEGRLDVPVAVVSRDEFAEIAHGVNAAREAVQGLIRALDEMCDRHSRTGDIDWYPRSEEFRGAYRDVLASVCTLTRNHVEVTMKAVDMASRYADGDFSDDLERLPGKRGEISAAMDRVKGSFMSVSGEIRRLAEAAATGDFSVRGAADRYRYDIQRSIEALNRLMESSGEGLHEASEVLGLIAQGNLTARMSGRYQGTFAELQTHVNATSDRLREIVTEIRSASGLIHQRSKEIARGNADLSERTERQAAHLEETAASTEQLTATVKRNAEHSQHAHSLAAETRAQAADSQAVVGRVVNTMREIDNSAGRITEIVALIDGIAFQTNILALNAAVEAARAGDQGRGFAVVASEVRSLAQRSAAAAKDVRTLIDESTSKVATGCLLVDQAGNRIEQVLAAVGKVSDIVSQISAATREQAAGIDQVARTVTELDDNTQRNAALVEEASAAAEDMESQARILNELVSRFTLDAAPANSQAQPSRRVKAVASH